MGQIFWCISVVFSTGCTRQSAKGDADVVGVPKTVVTFCVTVTAIGDVIIMLPACIIVGAAGDDVTMIQLACWLHVTVPVTGDDATIAFSEFRLCVTIPVIGGDVTVCNAPCMHHCSSNW